MTPIQTISVQVTSNVDPVGITLNIEEDAPNSGTFTQSFGTFAEGQYTGLVFSDMFIQADSSTTLSIQSNTAPVNVCVSSSSNQNEITITLANTGMSPTDFEAQLNLSSIATNPATNTLEANTGDIIKIRLCGSPAITSALVTPNTSLLNNAIAIDSTILNTVTASYQGIHDTATVDDLNGPGGGGGGFVRPIVVLNAILSLFGGSCKGDCIPPTLGMIGDKRIVSDGFSYNGNSTDAQLFYTPYPLITTLVGYNNTAVLKIYENQGIDNIRHVEIGFGLGKGEVISQSKAVIMWDRAWDGKETVTPFDPEDSLENIKIKTSSEKCSNNSQDKCLTMTIYHTFRQSLDFNMIGTNVWDYDRNGWQNYFNHGISIEGKSMNPPKQIQVLDRYGYNIS